jgi:hypothetical protein
MISISGRPSPRAARIHNLDQFVEFVGFFLAFRDGITLNETKTPTLKRAKSVQSTPQKGAA